MSAARFKQVADAARIEKAVSALNAKGFAAQSVPNAAAAKEAVLKLIPAGSEVFTYSSVTLDAAGITEALNAAPYVSLRDKMYALDLWRRSRGLCCWRAEDREEPCRSE